MLSVWSNPAFLLKDNRFLFKIDSLLQIKPLLWDQSPDSKQIFTFMQPKVEFIFLTPPVKRRGFGSGIEVIGFSKGRIASLLKIRNIEMDNASPVKYLFMKCMGWWFPADGAMNTKWLASTKRLSKSFHCWPARKAAAPASPISAGVPVTFHRPYRLLLWMPLSCANFSNAEVWSNTVF